MFWVHQPLFSRSACFSQYPQIGFGDFCHIRSLDFCVLAGVVILINGSCDCLFGKMFQCLDSCFFCFSFFGRRFFAISGVWIFDLLSRLVFYDRFLRFLARKALLGCVFVFPCWFSPWFSLPCPRFHFPSSFRGAGRGEGVFMCSSSSSSLQAAHRRRSAAAVVHSLLSPFRLAPLPRRGWPPLFPPVVLCCLVF